MHREVMDWLDAVVPKNAESVIEIGSRSVNGTPRVLFGKATAAGKYLGVDIEAGDGVDVVANAATWKPPHQADVVLCCEVFEHTADWKAILKTMAAACKPGGMVIVTAAGPSREPHSAADGGPIRDGEHYQNIEPGELLTAMKDAGFCGTVVSAERGMMDVRAVGMAESYIHDGIKTVSIDIGLPPRDVIDEALAPQPFISLCMIVKDGERTLPALFESIEGLFDEIVVVDTGSTDSTREIVAEAAGHGPVATDGGPGPLVDMSRFIEPPLAHEVQPGEGTVAIDTKRNGVRWVLAHFGWCDDFSKARNFSFGLATGRWRAFLDHDDRIEYRGPARHKGKPIDLKAIIRRLVEKNPKINVVQMPYDYIDGVSKEMKPRIVLWERGFSWRFPIHEQFFLNDNNADASVSSKGTRISGQIDDLHVVHDKSIEEHEASANRNAAMIARALEREVDDETHSHLLFHHALSLFQMQDYAGGDRILVFIEKTLEGGTFWLQARRQRIMAQALFLNDLDAALELAGGLYSHLPELRDGPNYIGWVQALRRNWPRAADAFDMGKHLVVPYAYVEDQWMSDGAHVAARALAYAHLGRVEEARPLLDELLAKPQIRDHEAVHDMRVEADRVCMRIMAYRRLMDHVDALLWSSQPREAIAALATAPANVREMPQVQERIRHTERLIAHLQSGEAYAAAYSAPSDKYHSYSHDVLSTERALTVIDWVEQLDRDGPPIHLLSIGSHDALIEDVLLEKNERIHVTVCDVSANASETTEALRTKYPGRVDVHVMAQGDPYDWGAGVYDAVMCFEVIEHVPDAVRATRRLSDRLSPTGRLFVSTPIADRWMERHLANAERTELAWHVRAFTGPSLWDLMRQNGLVRVDSTLVEGRDATLVFDSGVGDGIGLKNLIEIVIPTTPVPFDAVSPEHGFLGGSEEAVVRLSRSLSKMGHDVVIYAPEKRRDGARMIGWDGVLWRSADEFDAGKRRTKDNAVVFWRCPQQVAQYREYVKARGDDFSYLKFLWTHDAAYNATTEQYGAVDRILTLSEHHDRCLEADGAPKEKFLYFPNGIDEADFPPLVEDARDPHKVIYASSPDRGLARLLNIWDNVRAAVPDATLDIYYAWDLARKLNPKMIADFEARIDELKDKGVVYHGGIDQPSLHDAYRRSGVFGYPVGGKVETFCISSVKAMAAGAWPVVSTAGALPEVVDRHGTIVPEGHWDLFESALIRALQEPATFEQRVAARAYAVERFSWSSTAKRLIEYIRSARGPDAD